MSVLLDRSFRSPVLAAQGVFLNLLSIEATRAITEWVPLMTFAFLFGLSMDYEVFLLSRMREEYDAAGSTQKAVVEGLGRIGHLVTSVALILFWPSSHLRASRRRTSRS
jgi:putative drug exporter of the RND superfamily